MTRLEAIKALNNLCEVRKKYGMATMEYEVKVLETAICSLEAWDEVRAEIDTYLFKNEFGTAYRQEVADIIDKHLREVEE